MSNGAASNKVIYTGICDKCLQSYQRDITIIDEAVLHDPHLTDQEKAEACISSTEKALCSVCAVEFIEWMGTKGYLKTDCWCGHIQEWMKEVK